MHEVQAVAGADHDRLRRRRSGGAARDHRRGPRRGGRPSGEALRRPRRPAPHEDARLGRHHARGGLHLQHREVPAAGEPESRAGGDRGVRAVPGGPAGRHPARRDLHAGDLRVPASLADAGADQPPARPAPSARRRRRGADVPSGVPPAEPRPRLPASGVRRPQAHPAGARPGPGRLPAPEAGPPARARRHRPSRSADLHVSRPARAGGARRPGTARARSLPRPSASGQWWSGSSPARAPGTRHSGCWRPCSIPCRR